MSKKMLAQGFNLPKPPPRTPLDERSVEQFTSGEKAALLAQEPSLPDLLAQSGANNVELDEPAEEEAEVVASGPVSVARSAPAKHGTSKRRREDPGERVTVYLPSELATELRLLCVRKRYSVSHAMTEAVQRWLKSESKR